MSPPPRICKSFSAAGTPNPRRRGAYGVETFRRFLVMAIRLGMENESDGLRFCDRPYRATDRAGPNRNPEHYPRRECWPRHVEPALNNGCTHENIRLAFAKASIVRSSSRSGILPCATRKRAPPGGGCANAERMSDGAYRLCTKKACRLEPVREESLFHEGHRSRDHDGDHGMSEARRRRDERNAPQVLQ